MINLTLNDIRRVSHELSFKRGAQYYQNRLVKDVVPEINSVKATVSGSKLYEVHIGFQPGTGNLSFYKCNCPAFSPYSGACKHIVATLFEILYTKEKLNTAFEKGTNDLVIKAFTEALQERNEDAIKKEVNLEVTLEVFSKDYTYVSLRIGLDKLYVLKDFHALQMAIKQGGTVNFGQRFTFDAHRHCFSELDEKILNVLRAYDETYHFIKPNFYQQNDIQVHNKFHLPDHYLAQILKVLEHKPFVLKTEHREIQGSEIHYEMDLPFSVSKDAQSLVVQCNRLMDFYPLTKDYHYIYCNDQVYRLGAKEKRYFQVLVKHITKTNTTLHFDESNKHRFVSAVLPILKALGPVNMDQEILSNMVMEPLVTNIYLDRWGNTLQGKLDFMYGDYVFHIFPHQEPEIPSEQMIVRDEAAEGAILSLLSANGCELDGSGNFFTIHDDEHLFNFIYEVIPSLQKKANIFYSEDFKNLHIRPPFHFTAKVRINEQSDMLEFSFDMEDMDPKELSQVIKSLQEKKKYYRLKDGRYLNFEDPEVFQVADLIKELGIKDKDLLQPTLMLPKYKAFTVNQFIEEHGMHMLTRNDTFQRLITDIREPESLTFELPQVQATLRNYQVTGFQWFKILSHYGFGGILADDMGLGKTLQAITLLKSGDHKKPSIVVAPTSLVYNWQDEFAHFAPDMKVCVIHGSKKSREEIFKSLQEYQVLITSYGLLKRDLEAYLETEFEYCFIDEAQHIKNPDSLNAKSVKKLRSTHRFALTGTPIENSLTELWSIFDFIMPGYLSSHSKFVNQYEKPIVKEQDAFVLRRLTSQIKPFILRRLKTDVLKELPPKIETKVTTELSEKQKKLYVGYLDKIKKEIRQDISSQGYHKSTIKILAALTRLRQICCHPALFADNYTGTSSKLELLEELLTDGIESNHRILIFSQFTSMLKLIEEVLVRLGIEYYYLDGSTPAEDRRDMVVDFNNGAREVFLISLKAGGTGLNLTGADMVIHFDPWWNPAAEDQATDRAYRIGQDKPVQVMKLLTTGTIEEKIFQLQQRKKSLIESVIQPGETLMNKLTEEEVMALLE